MSTSGECMAHVVECREKAKSARSEEDKQSWLAMADSWLQTAELKAKLNRQRLQAA